MTRLRICAALLALTAAALAHAAEKFEPKTLEIGAAATDF